MGGRPTGSVFIKNLQISLTSMTGKNFRHTKPIHSGQWYRRVLRVHGIDTENARFLCIKIVYVLCQYRVLIRPTCDTGHCLVWWPGASFGGQAPRWYPRFTLGDLFVTTLIVKWPGVSFGGQAPRWYPRFCWAVPKKKKGGAIHSGQWY